MITHQQLVAEQRLASLQHDAMEVIESYVQLLVADRDSLVDHQRQELRSALIALSRTLEHQEVDHTHSGLWPHRAILQVLL